MLARSNLRTPVLPSVGTHASTLVHWTRHDSVGTGISDSLPKLCWRCSYLVCLPTEYGQKRVLGRGCTVVSIHSLPLQILYSSPQVRSEWGITNTHVPVRTHTCAPSLPAASRDSCPAQPTSHGWPRRLPPPPALHVGALRRQATSRPKEPRALPGAGGKARSWGRTDKAGVQSSPALPPRREGTAALTGPMNGEPEWDFLPESRWPELQGRGWHVSWVGGGGGRGSAAPSVTPARLPPNPAGAACPLPATHPCAPRAETLLLLLPLLLVATKSRSGSCCKRAGSGRGGTLSSARGSRAKKWGGEKKAGGVWGPREDSPLRSMRRAPSRASALAESQPRKSLAATAAVAASMAARPAARGGWAGATSPPAPLLCLESPPHAASSHLLRRPLLRRSLGRAEGRKGQRRRGRPRRRVPAGLWETGCAPESRSGSSRRCCCWPWCLAFSMARCSTMSCRRSCGKPRRWRSSTSSTRSPFLPSYKVRLTGRARPVANFAPRLPPRLEKWLWWAVGTVGATSDLQGHQKPGPQDPGVSEMTNRHPASSSGSYIRNWQQQPCPTGLWMGGYTMNVLPQHLSKAQLQSGHTNQDPCLVSCQPIPEGQGFLVSRYLLSSWLC